jgi:hypothetical protein
MILHKKLQVPYEKIKYKEFVLIKCDYCGKETEKRKCKIIKGRKLIEKDCCSEDICTKKKLAEVNVLKHGVVNCFQRIDIKHKIKKTNLEKYGCEYAQQNEKIREKSKATCFKNYGVKHALQNKELLKKAQEKSKERYGSKFPIQLDKFKEKVRKTNLKKYGIENFLELPQVKEKIKQTNIEKYGEAHPAASVEIQEKIKQTNIKKYGVKCVFETSQVKEKIKQTNIEKYGSPFPIHKFGKTQESIRSWLNEYGYNFNSDYEILEGKELDLYDSDKKIAIEYCGLYWHNEDSPEPRNRKYHYYKYKKCKDNGIQLLTIFDDEWNNKQNIIKSVILSKLGVFETRLYARKCIVKEIDKKSFGNFCDQYHIQGKNSLSLVCFGLFYNNELVGVIDLGRHHRKKEQTSLVLTRLCFKEGYQIVGGSSKLLSACVAYCKKNNIKNIISWSDNRWSNGNIYKNLGFIWQEDLNPDYSYVNFKNPKKRLSKQSQKKGNTDCPKEISELDWAKSRGLSRIWDCGKTRWIYVIN